MITFICCSIRPEMVQTLEQNIKETIGVPFEFIAFDNRENGLGICKVYNLCAQKAKYEYLCFLHEDIQFNTPNCGEIITSKLSEPDCGVIGFAGSIVKHRLPSGWGYSMATARERLIQHSDCDETKLVVVNPHNEDFAQVITLDGLCMFVRKDVWAEHLFDENMLTGFHGYDIDFALNVAQHFKNYVCCAIEVEHFSAGSLNDQWRESVGIIHKKWRSKLPMYTPEWYNRRKEYDRIDEKYYATCDVMVNFKEFENPNILALNFFKNHWYHSRFGWKILSKVVSNKLKKDSK